MRLLLKTIRREVDELDSNNVKVITIGNLADLPEYARRGMENAIERTKDNTGLILNLALSYSSRKEILDAVRRIAEEGKREVDEQTFSGHLYTAGLPDPDLLIRTSGELRISNFLLWQLAYTEIYVTDVLWPDFRREELYKAVEDYQQRERRFGKVSEQI